LELHKVKTGKNKFENNSKSRSDNPSKSFRNSRDDRSSRYSRDDRGESATVTCADCGIECKVPFVPKTDKPVYCSDCFRQSKSQYSENDSYSDIPEMTEAQDIPEMTEAQDIPEMTEAQAEKEKIKDLNQKKNYLKNKKVSFLAGLKNSITP